MFASIVGHAIFHTAARSGPSTIDRSYRDFAGGAPAPVGSGAVAAPSVTQLTGTGVVRPRASSASRLHEPPPAAE